MTYKAFEDMKHDIPEGATHYSDECDSYHFTWFKFENEVPMLLTRDGGFWVKSAFERDIKPIPQTETPEEKEAFDSMANDSELPNSSEWKNGDECLHTHHDYAKNPHMTYIGQHPFINDLHICLSHLKGVITVSSCYLAKPETPQQREERERLEFIKLMCETVANKCGSPSSIYEMYCAALYDAGYRKAK